MSTKSKKSKPSTESEVTANGITLKQAKRVLEVVDAGLCHGLGKPKPGHMCVEAAVSYALGLPHGDDPSCVNSAVRRFKIRLNDSKWSSNEARAKGMRKLAIAQLGTNEGFDQKLFVATLVEQTIRKIVPIALRAAASIKANKPYSEALEVAARRCENEGSREAALAAKSAADDAAADAAYAAYAAAYAYAAADDAAADAAYAAYAAYAAADAADAAAAAYAKKRRDTILGIMADIGVQALRIAGAAGIKLMDKLIKD